MVKKETLLGGMAAGCAAWLIITSMLGLATKKTPIGDGNACDRAFEKRMYQRMEIAKWLDILSGIACAVAAFAFLKMQSASLAYGSSAMAVLAGGAGAFAVFHHAATARCTETITPQPDTR